MMAIGWCLLALTISSWYYAGALPEYWAARTEASCNALPQQQQSYGAHSPPVDNQDSAVFSVSKDGKIQQVLRPNKQYTVQVTFPAPRLALIMSSNGRLVPESSKGLSKMAAADPLGCPNRLVFGRKSGYHPQKSFTFELVTPGSDSTGRLQLTAVSAANEVSPLNIASVQLNLDASPAAPRMSAKAQNTELSPAKDLSKASLPASKATSSGLRMAAAQSPSTASMMAAYAPRPVPPNMLSYEDLQLMLPGLLNSDGTINSDAIAPAAAKLSQLLAAKSGFSNQQVASTPQAESTSNRLRMSQAAAESTYDDIGHRTQTGGRVQQQRSAYPTLSRRAPGQQIRRLAPSEYQPGSANMPQSEPAAYISAIDDVFGEAKPANTGAWKPRQQDLLPILPSIHDEPTTSIAAAPTPVSADAMGALLQNDAAAAVAGQTSQAAQLPASVQPPLLGEMLPAQSDQRTAAGDSVETDLRRSPLEDSSLPWNQAAANLDDAALSASGWNVQDPLATTLLTNENTQLLQQQFSETQQQASQLPEQQTLLQQQQQSLEQQVKQQLYQSGSGNSQEPPQTASTDDMQVEAAAAPTPAYQPRPRYNPVRFDLRMPAMRLPSPMG